MNTQDIKERLVEIAAEGCTLVYTDKGQGSGGPGYMTGYVILEMIESGLFNDAEYANFDHDLARDAFEANEMSYSDDDDYFMIEFDKSNNYSKLGFLWID